MNLNYYQSINNHLFSNYYGLRTMASSRYIVANTKPSPIEVTDDEKVGTGQPNVKMTAKNYRMLQGRMTDIENSAPMFYHYKKKEM